jgi:ParB/RepB/Spo0J family partition protein
MRPDGKPTNLLVKEGVWMDPRDLEPTPDNARNPQPTDPTVIELGKSLAICQLNAVQARPHPTEPDKLDLRAGARRRAAAESAGIPIRVDVYDWDDETAFAVTMAENRDREDLTVLEEAKLCQRYLARHTLEEACDFLGRSAEWIRRRACLSRLTAEALAYGSPDWTIGYWEALALLEPEAQREVLAKELCYTKAEDLTLSALRSRCFRFTRTLGTMALWPMDSRAFPGGPCAECSKRKNAVGYLPGFQADGEADECLDRECYDKRRKAWLQTQVAGLHAKHPDAPILVDYTTRDDLKNDWATKDEYQYDTKPHGDDWKPVKVILAIEGHVRAATRYARPSVLAREAEKEAEISTEDRRRWKAAKVAVEALRADLCAAADGGESPVTMEQLSRTWEERLPVTETPASMDVLLVAIASMGTENGAIHYRSAADRQTRVQADPLYGNAARETHQSPWHPLECLGTAGNLRRMQEVIDGAQDHLFRSLCRTCWHRLSIDTLKSDADNAMAEAKTVCEFLGLDWAKDYAAPAGLEG